MLIFVSGHYPILGTQMLYFLDPILRARAEVAAPTAFYQIEGDRAVPQKAIDRTPNRISKPEVVPPDTTPLTEGEKGFWKNWNSDSETDLTTMCHVEPSVGRD